MRVAALVALLVALAPHSVRADDFPVAGDRLMLKDPADSARRSVRFSARRDPGVNPANTGDPRVLGATIEVTGEGFGDGTSGPITLPAGGWIGLGNPAGSKGYKWNDPTRALGIKSVVLKAGASGGSLTINGGGNAWPYAVTQAQGTIQVKLTLGTDVYCASFTTYVKNQAGSVSGKDAVAPLDCSGPTPAVCGNGVAEGVEECDDGNTMSGDGCSATCELENASALCAGVPTVAGTGLDSVRVVSGLTRPVYVTSPRLDPNRLFVVEQDGLIRVVVNGTMQATPFLDVQSKVSCCGEQGLLSMAFDPAYESNGRFFISYTNNSGDSQVSRYQVSGNPNVANGTETMLLTVTQPFANHNGGLITFGPDGYLYFGLGDGGAADDPGGRSQNDGEMLGKMLRLDVSGAGYTVPPTNPFVGPGNPLDEIWAKGLRNPWRYSFDRGTGDLYIADVGQGQREEVDVQPAASTGGENYGWDVFEGNLCHEPISPAPTCPGPAGYTFPVLEYDHGQGCSITGGYVYRGCRMPDLRGTYFYSDICSAFVKTFKGVSGGVAQNLLDRTADVDPGGGLSIGGVSSFGEDARGEMYIVDYGGGGSGQGEVYKLVPGS